jgi:ATP-binding cassette, subfamily B, bacterial MsbA
LRAQQLRYALLARIAEPMSDAPPSTKALYLRLLRHVWPYRWVFLVSTSALVIGAATDTSFAALMKWMVDGTFVNKDPSVMKWLPLAIIGITLVRVLTSFASHYSINWVGSRVVMDLRKLMFTRLMQLPLGYFSDHASGNLISKFTFDVNQVNAAATGVITVAIKDTLTIVGLLAWLLYLNWQLTLFALTIAPLLAWMVRKFSVRMRQVSRGTQRAMGGITQVLDESIEGHRVVKVFGGQEYEINRFHQAINRFRLFSMKQAAATASNSAMGELVAALMLALIVFLVTRQSAANETTVGGFVSFITAAMMLLAPLKRLTNINEPLQRGLAAAESVFELLDEPAEIDTGPINIGRAQGKIEFENVTFRYPTSEIDALRNVTFVAERGETIAFVGSSGSGKTTLANLIPRFFHAEQGRILVDGHDLTTIRLKSLRANIASVSQDVVLFNDSVAANIAYGPLANSTREQIIAAAEAAFAMEFIAAMPEGLETLIGENGVKLSGGQRQRLAIARALLKDAPILILDEATSALDTESERQVQFALENLMKSRTTIVIAHRLSTIEGADKIIVMDAGRIAEIGSHAELLHRGGAYARLHRVQFAA